MARKKIGTSKVYQDSRKGEFITSKQREQETIFETLKREALKRRTLPVSDAKSDLHNAISKAARHDAQTSKSLTIKNAKRARRDVIVKTIMRHNRQAH